MFSWMDPNGEYILRFCFCLFNKKMCALLISFPFTYYAWKPMHIWALQNLNVKAWVL